MQNSLPDASGSVGSNRPKEGGSTRVVLIGASGTIGQAVYRALVAANISVTCLGRTRPDSVAPQSFEACDLSDSDAVTACLPADADYTAIISCIASRTGESTDAWAVDYGINQSVLTAAKSQGIGHYILLSAICVQKPQLGFQQAKLAFETKLKAAGVTYSIIRPTAFFKSLSGQVDRVRAGKPFLVFGNGQLTACKPISDRDLADFIVSCIEDSQKYNTVLPIGGPGPAITPLDQTAMFAELTGDKVATKSVPPGLLLFVAKLLDFFGFFYPPLKVKAALARIGHYYATESMLLWDETAGRYDAEQTPEHGSDRLVDHYRHMLQSGARDGLGAHKVF